MEIDSVTMARRKISGVLFDWDGVLLDSLGASMNVYNRILPQMGMKPLSREEFLQLQSPNWYEFYSSLGIPEARWKELDEDWMRLYREEDPGLQPDAMKCVVTLKRSGFRLALISNGSKSRVEGELGKFGLRSFLDIVHCGEKKEELKPSPLMLERALSELDLKPGNAVYIGDSPADIRASKKAGIQAIALAREPVQAERLLREGPDCLFRNLEEVTDFLVGDTPHPD